MASEFSTTAPDIDQSIFVEISDPAVMSKVPLVSVLMVTYNHESYIAQAIEGVLMQETGFPIELVVGEDCSTDRTRDIVMQYQKAHPDIIRVILWDRNVGLRRNFLKLSELLRGQYFAINEGDDYWTHPGKLQMQVNILEAEPEIGLVHGGVDMYDMVNGRRYPWRPRRGDYDEGDIFNRYLGGDYFVYNQTPCVRTELFHAVLRDNPDAYDEKHLMVDTQLWLELSRITRLKLINEPLATYNILPDSVSRPSDKRKLIRFLKSGLEMRMHYMRKYNVDASTRTRVRTHFAREFLVCAYITQDRGLAEDAWVELKSCRAPLGLKDLIHYTGAKSATIRSAVEVLRGRKSKLSRTQE